MAALLEMSIMAMYLAIKLKISIEVTGTGPVRYYKGLKCDLNFDT